MTTSTPTPTPTSTPTPTPTNTPPVPYIAKIVPQKVRFEPDLPHQFVKGRMVLTEIKTSHVVLVKTDGNLAIDSSCVEPEYIRRTNNGNIVAFMPCQVGITELVALWADDGRSILFRREIRIVPPPPE